MENSTPETKRRKRGRQPEGGAGELIGVRMHPATLDALDAWRRSQPNPPTRPEAIRRLVGQTLMWRGVSSLELWDAAVSHFKADPDSPAFRACTDLIAQRNPGMSGAELVAWSHKILEEAVGRKLDDAGHPIGDIKDGE
jgi:hypothetical protein